MDLIEGFFFISFFGFIACFFFTLYALTRYASLEDARFKRKEKTEIPKEGIENKSFVFTVWSFGFLSWFLTLISAAQYSAQKATTVAISFLNLSSALLLVYFILGCIYFIFGFVKTLREETEGYDKPSKK